MKKLSATVIQVSVEEFRQRVDEMLRHIKNGMTVVISENGQTIASLKPTATTPKEPPMENFVSTPEEIAARFRMLEKALKCGKFPPEESYLANPVIADMGETDSSNLDDELYS